MLLTTPLPLSQTVTPSRTPSPLERDVLYGRPLSYIKYGVLNLRMQFFYFANSLVRRFAFVNI